MGNNKYGCDEHFFDSINTAEKAYWLGFIAADGCVSDVGRLSVVLSYRDIGHIRKLRQALHSDHPVGTYKASAGGKTFDTARLTIQRLQLVQSLRSHGVVPRKSLVIAAPKLSSDLMVHYWRGLFDGDGSIYESGGKWAASLVGSSEIVQAFSVFAENITGSRAKVCRSHKGGTMTYTVSGRRALALVRALYLGQSIYLDRKYEKASELMESFHE